MEKRIVVEDMNLVLCPWEKRGNSYICDPHKECGWDDCRLGLYRPLHPWGKFTYVLNTGNWNWAHNRTTGPVSNPKFLPSWHHTNPFGNHPLFRLRSKTYFFEFGERGGLFPISLWIQHALAPSTRSMGYHSACMGHSNLGVTLLHVGA